MTGCEWLLLCFFLAIYVFVSCWPRTSGTPSSLRRLSSRRRSPRRLVDNFCAIFGA